MKRKLICCAALLLLCTPILAGCDGKSSGGGSTSDAQVQSGTQQQQAAESIGNKKDYDAAYKAATAFFKSCVKGDREKVLERSNLQKMGDFTMLSGYNPSEEDMKEQIDGMLETLCAADGYEVSNGSCNEAALKTYQQYLAEAKERVEKNLTVDADDEKLAKKALEVFVPVDLIYTFETRLKYNGSNAVDTMYVLHTEDGWIMDVGMLQAMVDYMSQAKVKMVDRMAKEISDAMTAAVKEMGADAKKLDGDYSFVAADFAGASETASDIAEVFRFKAASLDADLKEMDEVQLRMKKGELEGLAIRKIYGSGPTYGTWPTAMIEDTMYYLANTGDALKYALGEYDSPAPF
ncbi:MAG: hypothetical protein IJL32_14835 [Oscillospiraceae bacterium]|nr:hypothetical protein [Oscillospiraceae bacterium]